MRKGGKLLYRQPAYLLCTDVDLPLDELLQYYLWRWGIEVNFRDEKSLIGTGEAQVRTEDSNQHLPATSVAAYALLWTAALEGLAVGARLPELAPPKWRRASGQPAELPSTGDLLRALRFETWAGSLRPGTFSRFVSGTPPAASEPKPPPDLPAALFAAA